MLKLLFSRSGGCDEGPISCRKKNGNFHTFLKVCKMVQIHPEMQRIFFSIDKLFSISAQLSRAVSAFDLIHTTFSLNKMGCSFQYENTEIAILRTNVMSYVLTKMEMVALSQLPRSQMQKLIPEIQISAHSAHRCKISIPEILRSDN